MNTQIKEILGKENVEAVELTHLISGEISRLRSDAVLIRIGVEPNTELFRAQVELDQDRYIKTDANCATDRLNIFAVGDVTNRIAPTIITAAGHGAIVAKAILAEFDS